MGSIRRADHDEVDIRIFEDAVNSAMDPDGNAKALVHFSAGRGWVALKDGSEREEIGQREDEWDVEFEASEADTENARPDGRRRHVAEGPRVQQMATFLSH